MKLTARPCWKAQTTVCLLLLGGMLLLGPPGAIAQDASESPLPAAATEDAAEGPSQPTAAGGEELDLLALIARSKWLMLPIGLMSLLVVAFAIERGLALRRRRVLPLALVRKLGFLGNSGDEFDPREAYRICQQYPSSASNVIKAMLLKIGRPHAEIEHAIAEASDREAERLFANVRWLTLAAGVTPLMGLFGTVWGMIRAFHDATQMAPGMNKADYLAEGIYTALVTTLGGLAVAIPAAILAHYFEGRIQSQFHRIDELLFQLTPLIEQYEGRVRFVRGAGSDRDELATAPLENAPPPRAESGEGRTRPTTADAR